MGNIPGAYVCYWNPCWVLSRVSSLPSSTPIIGVYALQFSVFDVEQSTILTEPGPREASQIDLSGRPRGASPASARPIADSTLHSNVGRLNAHIFCRLWAGRMRRWFDNSNDPTEVAPDHPVQFAKPYFQGVSFSFCACSNFGLTGGPGREQFFPGFVLQYVAASLSLHLFDPRTSLVCNSPLTRCSLDIGKRYLRKSRISGSLSVCVQEHVVLPLIRNAFWHFGSRHITLRWIDHPELFVFVEEIISYFTCLVFDFTMADISHRGNAEI